MAQAGATNPNTGAVDESLYARLNAQEILAADMGRNLPGGAANNEVQAAENIAKASEDYQAQVLLKQEQYLSAIAAGIPGYNMQGYGQIGLTPIPTTQAAGLSPVGFYQRASANLSAPTAGYSASSVLSMAAPTSPEQAVAQTVVIGQAQVKLLQEIAQDLNPGRLENFPSRRERRKTLATPSVALGNWLSRHLPTTATVALLVPIMFALTKTQVLFMRPWSSLSSSAGSHPFLFLRSNTSGVPLLAAAGRSELGQTMTRKVVTLWAIGICSGVGSSLVKNACPVTT